MTRRASSRVSSCSMSTGAASPKPKERETGILKLRYTASETLRYYRNNFSPAQLAADAGSKGLPARFNHSVYTWPFSASKHSGCSARWTYRKATEVQYPAQVQFNIESALGRGDSSCKIYPRVKVDFKESREEDSSHGKKNIVYRDVLRNGKKVTPSVIQNAVENYESQRQIDYLEVSVAIKAEVNELRDVFDHLTCKSAKPVFYRGLPFTNQYNLMLRLPASNELLQRIWMEKTNSKDAKARCKFFDEVLSVYKFEFLKGKGNTPNGIMPHEDFVRSEFCNLEHFKILREQTFVMTSKQYDRKLVQTSLAMRYPVYFGIPALVDFGLRSNYYHKERVKEVLGYDLLTRITPDGLESVRYVIAGRVRINPGMNKTRLKNICVVHAWGCNFEKRTTWDYKYIHKASPDEAVFRKRYREKTLEMFRMICEAAQNLGCKTIRIPAIGAGQYTNALPNKRKRLVDIDFLKCLEQVQREYPGVQISRRFPFNPSDPATNLFQKIKQDNTCLVNAWDSRSFIGNGGSEDKTIDGWMVTGVDNGKTSGNNTAFLHNVFFMPELMSPENWQFLENAGKQEENFDDKQDADVGFAFVWDDNGEFGHEIFKDVKEAKAKFNEMSPSYQCSAIFGFSIASERHNIIMNRKRGRTLLEKMRGTRPLMETLAEYFDSTVVPAYAKLQRALSSVTLKDDNPATAAAAAAAADEQI